MSCIGTGTAVGLEWPGSDGPRWFDLDCDEDWGEIDCGVGADGTPWAAVGNDEDGYARVSRAVEATADDEVEIGLDRLRELVESRTAAFSA